MYVDESGDIGLTGSPTRYFVLTGLVLHELRWRQTLDELIAFRREQKTAFGLKLREEIHASMPDLSLICVVVDKANKPATYDVFDAAWKALIQRFENTLAHRNFPGPRNPDDMGMLFPDRSDEKKLNALLRRMRAFNPVPSQPSSGYRNLQIRTIIEDPNYRDSSHSYFIQSVDVTAFLLYQHLAPSACIKKKSGQNYFGRLAPIVCKHASPKDPLHIVRL